jgi:energy-coupling factor transport system ATP-binding protein
MNGFIVVENMYLSLNHIPILKNINLSLDRHQFVSVVGPNGSGKTTLGKAITGILKHNQGHIYLNDTNISLLSLAEIGRTIGYLFQNPEKQIFAPKVIEELSFALKYKKVNQKIIEEKTVEMLHLFDLYHLKDATTFFLSQGEKQRLAIASVLLNEPEYLILDEPTTGLDIKRRKELSLLIDKLKTKTGILSISHDKEFINRHSERIITMKDGCIIDDKKY